MTSVAFATRPPRPRSRGAAAPTAPPPFAQRPCPAPELSCGYTASAPRGRRETDAQEAWRLAELKMLPGERRQEVDLPPELLQPSSQPPARCLTQPCLVAAGEAAMRPPPARRAHSEAPALTMATCCERGVEDFGCLRPPLPLVRNVASFEKTKEYMKSLRGMACLSKPVEKATGSSHSSRRSQRSRIDEAVQREYFGEGIVLEQAVDNRRDAGWAVKHRHVQRGDVGHCCFACRQPLRDLNEEVVVWTGAAIYRRFHPRCAASYVLHADAEKSQTSSGSSAVVADVVEGYADGWRALRERAGACKDPAAFSAVRGDLFTTVTITENGKKKAVPGLTHDQLQSLQMRHRWQPPKEMESCEDVANQLDCPICFSALGPLSSACVRLPCAPQHVCHIDCVWPWLRKASICPVCRKDLRALLPPARGTSLPPLNRHDRS